MKFLYCLLLMMISVCLTAQTVTISSKNEVCKDELIGFQANSSAAISGFNWDFGDNTTSNQSGPAHSYSTIGPKTVTITATFADGSTATDSKQITVHDLPKPDFSFTNSEFCFSSHNICLVDSSSMGSTTMGYQSRLILWGDGDTASSSNPVIGQSSCTNTYPAPGTYDIVIEVVNDKGCEAKQFLTATVLEDYDPSFRVSKQGDGCNEQEFCFTNNDAVKPANVVSWTYDYGDGNSSTNTNWSNNCHTYTTEGRYTVTLTTTLANGCVNTYQNTAVVNFVKIEIDVDIPDTTKCFPEEFFFSNSSGSGNLTWKLFDADTAYLKTIGNQKSGVFYPDCPGDFYIKLEIQVGDCKDSSELFLVKSNGVSAAFIMLNNIQCNPEDTTYFINKSKLHKDARTFMLWKMDDDSAASCSTSALNCNFETDTNAFHLYSRYDCYNPTLILMDSTSGCVDSATGIVAIENFDDVLLEANAPVPCIGGKPEYKVQFSHNFCAPRIRILFDSIQPALDWMDFMPEFTYSATADSNGYVTVGWAIVLGNEKIYLSADTSDYIIDSSRLCIDTIWFHHWFQLNPEPKLDFDIVQDGFCLPVELTMKYTGNEEGKLKRVSYRWFSGDTLSTTFLPDDTIPDLIHTYDKAGKYHFYLLAEDTFGCYNFTEPEAAIGYVNRIEAEPRICLGDSVSFVDVIRYIDDNYSYWEDSSRLETRIWDFDDGRGFVDTIHNPVVYYPAKGTYHIRMATTDSMGCNDTAVLDLVVGGVTAGIKAQSQALLCDQIVQFFDSSFSDFAHLGDTIEHYYWEFGDYTNTNILQNPFHYYSSNGTFTVTHSVTSVDGCTDTATAQIYIKGPEPYFDIVSDSVGCAPFTATFKSNSEFVSQFQWYMGDENNTIITSNKDTTFSFTYTEPGVYEIFLNGSDSFYNINANNTYTCQAHFPDTNRNPRLYRRIIVLPIPQVDFSFMDPVCVNQDVTFFPEADSIYTDFIWSIDGIEIDTSQGEYTYAFQDTGTYNVGLTPRYTPTGPYQRSCFDSSYKTIDVHYVEAGYEYNSLGNCSEYEFINFSVNAISNNWDFGNPNSNENTSTEINPTHSFGRDSGTFTVCLAVESAEACRDTFCREIVSTYSEMLKPYNVFTPGRDGLNDTYFFDVENTIYYHLKIFNRWGEKVFETMEAENGWNGTDFKTGRSLPEGTYFYVLTYQFVCDEERQKMEGQVEMIRGN